MRIAFVQTYPVYHDLLDTEQWLARINRDRWMPGIVAGKGHEVELWAADRQRATHPSRMEGFGRYDIQLFETSSSHTRTKKDFSDSMVDYALEYDADLHILKGVDGGAGLRLLDTFLLPEKKPFVFVIGGKYYNSYLSAADLVFYETEEQKQKLQHPGLRFWRKPVAESRLLRLPKSVDTELFRPMPDLEKEWDIVCVGRLINRYKSYDALKSLSERFRVCMVGGGPAQRDFEVEFPDVTFVGQVPNAGVPEYLNRAHAFIHPGSNDYFPRVLSEAAACGCILLAFSDSIAADVIPPGCGLRLGRDSWQEEISDLFGDAAKMKKMGENARKYAVETFHKRSTEDALDRMLKKFGAEPSGTG